MSKLTRNSKYGNLSGVRDDLPGINFRSKMEANVARYLNLLKARGEIQDWSYEPQKFYFTGFGYKRGPWVYYPDFSVLENDGTVRWIEVKGMVQPGDKTKWTRFKRHVSNNFEVIGKKEYKRIRDEYALSIPEWE